MIRRRCMRRRVSFVGGRNSPDRFYLLITLLGGPWATARHLGVHPATLWKWRVGKLPLSERDALRLRAIALNIEAEMSQLAFELQADATVARQRHYRDIARRTDLLDGLRRTG